MAAVRCVTIWAREDDIIDHIRECEVRVAVIGWCMGAVAGV